MSESGPSIEALTHRLVQTPQAMLAEPDQQVDVNAVLADLLRDLAGAHVAEAVAWRASSRNEARLSLLAAWVLADPWFVQRAPRFAAAAKTLLCGGLQAVSKLVDASRFVSDGDRREELARRVLAALQLLPESESEAVAADRLRTL
ncbi:MAG: hypothetical protein KTR31_30935, partial [Myxococcales bacterium]|nr:hypothetical protein [Myxococcales bacterium]